jgi:3-hydroxybutyryl-CoA dehydrogenase
MKIEKVGVVGCGLMGSGIAQVAAGAGLSTVVVEVDEARLREGVGRIASFLEKGVQRGKLSADAKKEVLSRIDATTSLEKLADVDVVIEAVLEDLAVKKELFSKLDSILRLCASRRWPPARGTPSASWASTSSTRCR